MKLTAGDGSEMELIPENDQVNVVLAKIEENNFTWDNEEVQKLRWKFQVLDEGPWKGKEINGDTSLTFTAHPNCKAYNWASAIAGTEFPPGYEFDTDEIIGMRCRILIGHKPSKQGRVFMNVKEVMPPKTAVQQKIEDNAAPVPYDPSVDGGKF